MERLIVEVHSLNLQEGEDDSPLQLISRDLLEHYRQCERNLFALIGELLARERKEPDEEDPLCT